jgi:hypothetical protein
MGQSSLRFAYVRLFSRAFLTYPTELVLAMFARPA